MPHDNRADAVTQVGGLDARVAPCSLCGGEGTRPVYIRHGFQWQRCTGCGLVRVNPQLTQEAIGGIYHEGFEHKQSTVAGDETVLPFHADLLGRIETLCGGTGRLLDVGCFEGRFLRDARELGWDVTGTEISERAAQFAREERGLDVRVGPLESHAFPGAAFDATVLLDVIEHLPDPRATLAEAARVLRPGGALFVWTPNFDCPARVIAGANWGGVVFPWHLYYFTAETLGRMVTETGFAVTDTRSRNWLLDFRARFDARGLGLEIPEQSHTVRRVRRRLDAATAGAFAWLDRHGHHWGAQIEVLAKRGNA